MVNGSWHGSVDQFMFDYKKKKNSNLSIVNSLSLGTGDAKKNMIMLPYNDEKLTKKILDKHYRVFQ